MSLVPRGMVRVESRLEARAAVRVAARVLLDEALTTTDAVVERLEALQYDTLSAERLTVLVPLAFGRVALKAKSVERFAWMIRIDADDDVVVDVELKDDPVFLEALAYAVESFEGAGLDEDAFSRLADNSAEVAAAARAEAAGVDLRQALVHETVWRSRLSSAAWLGLD